jgi:hypothetical protein
LEERFSLFVSNKEFRALVVERVKKLFHDEKTPDSKARAIFKKMINFFVRRINCGNPIIVDNFGIITKKIQKTPGRYDVVSGLYLEKEYCLIKFVPCPKFLAWFKDKRNRQVLCDKIQRRAIEFVAKYGELKLISNQ